MVTNTRRHCHCATRSGIGGSGVTRLQLATGQRQRRGGFSFGYDVGQERRGADGKRKDWQSPREPMPNGRASEILPRTLWAQVHGSGRGKQTTRRAPSGTLRNVAGQTARTTPPKRRGHVSTGRRGRHGSRAGVARYTLASRTYLFSAL